MNRRALFKLLALLPWVGPTMVQALAKAGPAPKRAYRPYLPAVFPKWNRALDGLEDVGKWVLDLERAQLPRDLVLPREGEIWEAVRDCEVTFRACLSFSWSDTEQLFKEFGRMVVRVSPDLLVMGGQAQLLRGERIRIVAGGDDMPLHVTFRPLRYDELHERIVPEEVRRTEGYRGYELSVKTARTISDFNKGNHQTYFNESFRAVENRA